MTEPTPPSRSPKVSVIIATRDRREVLEQCLTRYADQSYPDLEIIVVDNGSSDGTAEHLEQRFPGARVHRYEENQGPEALNLAAKMATGTYLWRTDDDAYPDAPTTIEDAVAFMERYQDVTVVSAEILERLLDYRPLDYYPFQRPERLPEDGLPMVEFWGTGAMIRRDAFLEVGGFWDVFYGEELDLSSRLILNGGRIRYAPWIKVRHLSAFANNRDQSGRWLLQAEIGARYQFTYFPIVNAIARTSVVWLGLMLSVVLHRMRPKTIVAGIRASAKGIRTGRRQHRSLNRSQRKAITFGRSIWDIVFRYYWVRWQQRKQQFTNGTK